MLTVLPAAAPVRVPSAIQYDGGGGGDAVAPIGAIGDVLRCFDADKCCLFPPVRSGSSELVQWTFGVCMLVLLMSFLAHRIGVSFGLCVAKVGMFVVGVVCVCACV